MRGMMDQTSGAMTRQLDGDTRALTGQEWNAARIPSRAERISALPLGTEPAHNRPMEWDRPAATGRPRSRTIAHEEFEVQASCTPDAVAIVCQEREVTYAELDARANQVANLLRERRSRRKTRVGLCLDRSPELVTSLLGILKAGGAFVPLEPSYPQERLRALVDETRPLLVVTDSRLAAKSGADGTEVIRLDCEREKIACRSTAAPQIRVSEENLATIMFSSGSTGTPKAISRPHRSFGLASARARQLFAERRSPCAQIAARLEPAGPRGLHAALDRRPHDHCRPPRIQRRVHTPRADPNP